MPQSDVGFASRWVFIAPRIPVMVASSGVVSFCRMAEASGIPAPVTHHAIIVLAVRALQVDESPNHPTRRMSAKRILLIQDDRHLASLYREKLEGSGFVVEQSRGVDQALRVIEERPPDLVLVDLVLSTGTGLQIIKQLRSLPQTLELPVLVFPTALTQMCGAAIHAGATKVVSRGAHVVGSVLDEVKVALGLPGLGDAVGTKLFQPDESWRDMVLEGMSEDINHMRHCIPGLVSSTPDYATQQAMWWHVHSFSEKVALAGIKPLSQFAGAMDMLLCDLAEMPEQMNPPVLRTIGQSVDFLSTLSSPENRNRAKDAVSASILIVDDEESARQFIGAAMQMAGLIPGSAGTPTAALEKLTKQKCDLIFLDVGMPEMNGFDLCAKIRGIEAHQKTPIVFLTGMATFQNRAQASLSGGNDFVGKPFNLAELGLKALMWIFRAQLGLL